MDEKVTVLGKKSPIERRKTNQMMFEGLKKTVDQNFLFSRVLLSEFMCSQ